VRGVRPRVQETQVRQLHVHNAGHALLKTAICKNCFIADLDPDPAFSLIVDPDPAFFLIVDPDPAFFLIADTDPKFAIYLSLGLHKGRPIFRRSLQPSQENI
jgi:hypothetical protein